MTLLSGSKSMPHTCSASIGRVSTRPALRRKYSRRAYSRAVSEISRLPRVTRRVAGSSRRSASWRDGRPLAAAPAEQDANTREELVEGERLGEVVVRAQVEARDPSGTLSRAVSMRTGAVMRCSRSAGGPRTVALRQHHVEDDEVVGRARRGPSSTATARRRRLDRVAFLLQPLPDEARDLALVLDHQDSHGSAGRGAREHPRPPALHCTHGRRESPHPSTRGDRGGACQRAPS